MSKFRAFKSHEPVNGLAAKTANGQVSKILSPMVMSDIKRAIASGNWTEMKEKARRSQTNGYDVEKITIKSIMRHTTGLPRNTIFFWDNEKKQKPISIDEALKGLKKQSIIYKPNRIYKYSNLAILLGVKL